MRKISLYFTAGILICSSLAAPISATTPMSSDDAISTVKQQLISFLQSGATIEAVPEANTIYPAVRLPLLASTVWMLMSDDPAMLELVYPRITSLVMAQLSMEATTGDGFIPGDGSSSPGEIYISPTLNALAALELHSLSLIASAAGNHEDAIEYREWSKQFTRFVLRTFYDSSHDCFYPLSAEGHFIVGFSPSLLLPMVTDRTISPTMRKRMADRLLYNIETGRSRADEEPLWAERSLRPVVLTLLSGVDGFPAARLKTIAESPLHASSIASTSLPRSTWSRAWRSFDSSGSLFSPHERVLSLFLFKDIALREDLLDEKILPLFMEEIERLTETLSRPAGSLDDHASNIRNVNSLLMRMSDFRTYLESEERLWKILDDEKWKRLSPSTRKMFTRASSMAISELNDLKDYLTASLVRATGFELKVRLPDMAVPVGRPVEMNLSVHSGDAVLDMERIFLQSGSNRWNLSDSAGTLRTGPGLPPVEWNRTLRMSPGIGPGIAEIPLFIDFMSDGKRIELHLTESLAITTGYQVSLDMPSGRLLQRGSALPVNISLKYASSNTIHGQVDGVFLDAIGCTPDLPARFAVNGGTEITNLPLMIGSDTRPAPGRYPFSLAITLDGRRIASFEKDIYVPMDWLHIGPISNRRWALEEGHQLQDDLSSTYLTPEGKELRWQKVAKGAYGPSGEVLPEHLYGSGSDRSMLLYTTVNLPSQKRVFWTLSSSNIVSLWINSDPLLESAGDAASHQGAAILRKGRNSILIATCWPGKPTGIEFLVSDDSGLPVAEMKNELSALPSRSIASTGIETGIAGHRAEAPDGRSVISFNLDWPGATEVSVIGEFNNWDPEATPMQKDSEGRWAASMTLASGAYHYKFLVDRTTRIPDPTNEYSEPDGFGGTNSVLRVK